MKLAPKTKIYQRLCRDSFILFEFSDGYQIDKKSIGTRHRFWKLPEETQTCIDVMSFAIIGDQNAAIGWRLIGIVHSQQGFKSTVPAARKIQAALLNPSVEVFGAQLVWK